MKRFNVTGLCVKDKHYMVDISKKIEEIMKLVDGGFYFTINRARQYGKTTTLSVLRRKLHGTEYICLPLSFEGVGDEMFEDSALFCKMFLLIISKAVERIDKDFAAMWQDASVTNFTLLGIHLDKLCEGKKIVLLIDEVDKTSRNRVFLGFLGMLRNLYLAREDGLANTFHNVILAGVHDIKNIKLKLVKEGMAELKEGERQFNSPWNIAAEFKVDMSFDPYEISTMLTDYEDDWRTGMDIDGIAQEIYKYTSGYPFFVSRMCQLIDEELDKNWTVHGVQDAVKIIFNERSVMIDDMVKNLDAYEEMYDLLYSTLIQGNKNQYSISDQGVYLASAYGYIKNVNKKVVISNRIFEILLTEHFVSRDAKKASIKPRVGKALYGELTSGGRFNMELCLRRFAEYYMEIYTEKNRDFLEEHCAIILLSYLVPLINGYGFFHVESQLFDGRRMDIVVNYGREQFILELKIWRGEVYKKNAYTQLLGYMEAKNLSKGYLVIFDVRKKRSKELKAGWVEVEGRHVFEVMM